MKRWGVIFILLLAFCGLADSAYVARQETAGAPLLCDIGSLSGCNVVAQSPYSKVFGIPLAEYGIVFYAILFALAALELTIYDRLLRRVLQWAAAFGFLASLYFTFLQVFVIHALCIYCLGSACIALLIFLSASLIEPIRRPADGNPASHVPLKAPLIMPPPTS